ncbi:MAG: MotA/TolQ/ExbB proton channel family protein [Longimicrobiales bacterium]|nr:MotA/TolQ/ExbB proton channel family protein [Longimicrobiales bacterium]
MENQYDLLTLFADGGPMMYPLILCSLVALGVIIAKTWTLFAAHRGTQMLLVEVEEAARDGRTAEAIEIAASTPGPTAAILYAGLRRIDGGSVMEGEIDYAISTTGTIELSFLERGLVVLATIANVAPLMGFLGTVAGMIIAFDAIARAGNVDPTLVAGGIKVALLTTAAGLVIALPVNIGYNYFVTRIDGLILDMEQGAQRILNIAWDLEKDGRLTVVKEKRGHLARAEPSVARSSGTPPSGDAPAN